MENARRIFTQLEDQFNRGRREFGGVRLPPVVVRDDSTHICTNECNLVCLDHATALYVCPRIVAGGLAPQSTRSDQKGKYVVSQATLSTETHRFYHMDGGRTRAAVHGMGPVLLSVVGGMLCGCGPVTVASKQRHEDTLSGLV